MVAAVFRIFPAMVKRIGKLQTSDARDREKIRDARYFDEIYYGLVARNTTSKVNDCEPEQSHWMIQERRASLIAQELKFLIPVARARLERQTEKMKQALI